jgi:hypothetical protein
VDAFQTGYRKMMARAGFRPQSAIPWQEEDFLAVLQHVQEAMQSAAGVQRVFLARDAFALSVGWHLHSRGKTVVDWHLHQLETEAGGSWMLECVRVNTVRRLRNHLPSFAGVPIKQLLEDGALADGVVIVCRPLSLKHDLKPEPFLLVMEVKPSNPLWLLQRYWEVAKEEGYPLQDVLFRPLTPDHKGFVEKLVDTSTYRSRLSVHFKAANIS